MLCGRWFGLDMVEDIDTPASDEELLVAVFARPSLVKKAGPILKKRPRRDRHNRVVVLA